MDKHAKERKAFEAAMNAKRFFPRELDFSMTKSPSGRDEYFNTHLESCWQGWQARAKWHPIETAPKDTALLLYCQGCYELGHFNTGLERWVDGDRHKPLKPSHWQPLSPPPAVKGGDS